MVGRVDLMAIHYAIQSTRPYQGLLVPPNTFCDRFLDLDFLIEEDGGRSYDLVKYQDTEGRIRISLSLDNARIMS
jgi:hypothetical protein